MYPDVTVFLAFGAGLVSFLSPCTLPLYPIFLSYLTGMTMDERKNSSSIVQKNAIKHTIFFLLGFSIIFIAIGFATSVIHDFFLHYQVFFRRLGSILIIIFGLMTSGIVRVSFLMRERKLQFKNRPSGYLGSFLIGLSFAAGWTPCMGPILATIIVLASTEPSMGIWYLLAYYLGFSSLFFLFSFFVTKIAQIKKYSNKLMQIGGWIMIVMGILLFFNQLSFLTGLLERLYSS